MAAPHVSGAAALLLQAQPGLSITETAYALTSTAVPLRATVSDTVPNNTFGWGRLDVLGAALSVVSTGSLSGTVTGAGGEPVPGAAVTASGEDSGLHATAAAGPDGRYALPLAAGPYTVTASAFGYYRQRPGARRHHHRRRHRRATSCCRPCPPARWPASVLDDGTGEPARGHGHHLRHRALGVQPTRPPAPTASPCRRASTPLRVRGLGPPAGPRRRAGRDRRRGCHGRLRPARRPQRPGGGQRRLVQRPPRRLLRRRAGGAGLPARHPPHHLQQLRARRWPS